MPPINPPAQRSGPLVTGLVVGWILCIASLIVAIVFFVNGNKAADKEDLMEKKYAQVITPDMLKSDEMDKLNAAKNDQTNAYLNSSMKLFDVAIAQRDELSKVIGSEDESQALNTARNSIEKAKAAGAKPAGDSLAATIDALVTEVNARRTEANNNKQDADDSKAKLMQTIQATQAQIDTLTKAMQQTQAEKDELLAQAQKTSQDQTSQFNGTADDLRKQLQAANDQINQLNSQVTSLNAKIKTQDTDLQKTYQKLKDVRFDPTQSIVRQPDGHILRLAGNNICFIDLGEGDHISVGLTFEVYDKVTGIPPPGDPTTDENLPAGKAAIEVLRVGPGGTSECRINFLARGAALSEGDLIANLVYDRNTKYKFLVFGKFDLDQNGVATANDAEIIKRLITQWGGELTNDVNVETDFVVLGKEPVVPDKPAADAPPDEIKKYDDAQNELDAYQDIAAKARSYTIPLLNQNRFLYLIGYYEQAKK